MWYFVSIYINVIGALTWVMILICKAILGQGTKWTIEMNFGSNHVPGAGSIVRPVDLQLSEIPLCYGCQHVNLCLICFLGSHRNSQYQILVTWWVPKSTRRERFSSSIGSQSRLIASPSTTCSPLTLRVNHAVVVVACSSSRPSLCIVVS